MYSHERDRRLNEARHLIKKDLDTQLASLKVRLVEVLGSSKVPLLEGSEIHVSISLGYKVTDRYVPELFSSGYSVEEV